MSASLSFVTEFTQFTKLNRQQLEFLVDAWDELTSMGLPRSAMEDSLYSFYQDLWEQDGERFIEYHGVIEVRAIDPGFWVQLIYVSESHRRKGIGKRLLAKAITVASQWGSLTKLGLGTRPENEAMQALAISMGLKASPRVIDFWITPRFPNT